MERVLHIYKVIILAISIMTIAGTALGQDLGSTSGLFRSKSTPSKAAPPKKSAPKKKSTTKKATPKRAKSTAVGKKKTPVKRKSTPKQTTAPDKKSDIETNAAATSKVGVKNQIAASRASKVVEDVIITVGAKTSSDASISLEEAISQGNSARNRRLYVEAENAYGRAVKLVPKDSRAFYGLGNIYSDQQRWEEAEASYRKALAIEPDSFLANVALSYVLTQPVVGSNLGERYAQAEEVARKAIALGPNSAIAYDQLGVALELRGIISEETQSAYEKALTLDPGFALAHAHMGRLLRKRGLTNESSASYREAIKLSANVPTMILVADVMQSQQRYLDSEQLLREALRRDPRNPTALYLLGRALITRRSFDEAESILKESLAISPRSFVSYTVLGSLYSQSGDLIKAEQTLNRALDFVSDNEKRRLAQEFESVGDGLMKLQKNHDAARVYRTAISLDGAKTSLAVKLATAQSRK